MERSLISSFSKIIDPENESNAIKPKVSYVYGEVTSIFDDGQMARVKIDGSEVECPMKSNITVEEGHRVMVMLRNHEGTIVNNVSTPATTIDFLKSDEGKSLIIDQIKDYVKDYVKDAVNKAVEDWLDRMFPIGAVLLSFTKVSPASIYGGVWVLISEGYALISTTIDDEGGDAPDHIYGSNIRTVNGVPVHTHTLSGVGTVTTSEAKTPHQHSMGIYPTYLERSATGSGIDSTGFGIGTNEGGFKDRVMVAMGNNVDSKNQFVRKTFSDFNGNTDNPKHSHTVDLSGMTIGTSGTGATVDVTPKHIKVYMWRRTLPGI